MAINEWNIWKRLGLTKEKEREEIKIKDDLDAVISFLKEIDVKRLTIRLEKMKDMIKEEEIIERTLTKENLTKQIDIFDNILKEYDFFQNDVDINGLRLKKIGNELLNKAKTKDLANLVKEKKKDMNWK